LFESLESDDLRPYTPLNYAGILILPPISEPIPRGEHRAATKAPYPPELPPTHLSSFQGFLALPQR